jgi:hypothetical protein
MSDVQVEIIEVAAGTPEYEAARAWHRANGSRPLSPDEMEGGAPQARALRYWLDNWGGYTGRFTLPVGEQAVSLEEFADRDPDATFLKIRFKFRDPSLVGTRDPNWSPRDR